ncbi:MAG TPA: hypothetical protein VI479_10735 [Blastocatellia bacterium]
MTAKFRVFGSIGVSSLCASITAACPLCHTELGQQVRSGIFGADFWSNLLFVLLPFPIFLLLAVALHYGFGRRTPNAKDAEPDAPKPTDNIGEESDHER